MKIRKQFITWLFDVSQKVYTSMFKKHESWNVSKKDLLKYPPNTIGKHIGLFLEKNGFELIPKVERHDAYHTITGFGITVEDEIALQCLCFGNGKRSLYLYGAIVLGAVLLPDYYSYYYKSYLIGKRANPFHHFDYKKLLNTSIDAFRKAIFSEHQMYQLKHLRYEQI